MNKYLNYSTEDFAADNHFRKWILGGGTAEEFWRHFLMAYPEKKEPLRIAAQMVRLLQFQNASPAIPPVEEELQATFRKINKQKTFAGKSSFRYAAAIVLICLVGIGYLFNSSGVIVHSTDFGEKQNVVLPDGSEVILNANSSIVYAKNWEGLPLRTVELKGEAFFEVVHQPNDAKFVVQTGSFEVEVIGTSFNLVNRPNKHQVMLKEGKIDVHFANDSDELVSFLDETAVEEVQKSNTLKLSPSQLFEAAIKERKWVHKKVNPSNYTAWLSNKFVCDHLPLSALAAFIENNYGWEVKTMDVELLDKEINGTIPSNNIDVLLDALPLILDARMLVDKQKKEIIFSTNPS